MRQVGLRGVAEGVEDAAIAARMSEHGVDTLQGYHFVRPSVRPVDEEGLLQLMCAVTSVDR